jgi:hypothetical protein
VLIHTYGKVNNEIIKIFICSVNISLSERIQENYPHIHTHVVLTTENWEVQKWKQAGKGWWMRDMQITSPNRYNMEIVVDSGEKYYKTCMLLTNSGS